MSCPLIITTTGPVQDALDRLGRSEDVRFSPNNRLLAVAGFSLSRCLLLRVGIETSPAGPRVRVDDFMELTSPAIGLIHGIDFLDDETLAVANRDGDVAFLRLPPGELAGRQVHLGPIGRIPAGRFRRVRTPGSVAVWREPSGQRSLLVCNNYVHHVTRHVIDERAAYRTSGHFFLRRGLKIPDGIAVSHDGRWIAVSSHGTHDVKIYSTEARLSWLTKAAGTLLGGRYPHGLRFTPDDRHILVADAGAPVVRVYERDADWSGRRHPVRDVPVLDHETFARGRTDNNGRINFEEGGPKGIDIDRSGSVVAITCEEERLAFFPFSALTG